MSFNPNILDCIEQDQYLSGQQNTRELIEAIHATSEVGDKLKGAYFKVLLARTLSDMKVRSQLAEPCLARQHKAMYKLVTDVVLTSDVVTLPTDDCVEKERKYQERQSRTKFATTAKSTISAALKVGIDIKALDIKTITKNALYAMTVDKRVVSVDELCTRALNTIDKAAELFDEILIMGHVPSADLVAQHMTAAGTLLTAKTSTAKGGKP